MRSGTTFSDGATGRARTLIRVLSVCWRALCVPVYAFLAILEPIVSTILALLAVLGVCMSLVFKFLRPDFPFWTMLGISIGFMVALMLYYALMRLVAPK
jgi:hypothetical protein